MLFYYIGLTWAAVFFTLGRRRIDYRVVALGALLPEALDLIVGAVWLDAYPSVGHGLVLTLALLAVVMVALRGSAAHRWFVLPIATLIHLALDAMWNRPLVLFWPAFGGGFEETGFAAGWTAAHPSALWLAAMEVAGAALVVYFLYAYRLRGERLAAFVRTGYLDEDRTLRRAQVLEQTDGMNGAIIEEQSTGRPRRPEDVEEGPGSEGQGAG